MLSFLASSRSFLRPPEKQPGNAARIRQGEFERVRPHLVRDPLHQRPDKTTSQRPASGSSTRRKPSAVVSTLCERWVPPSASPGLNTLKTLDF